MTDNESTDRSNHGLGTLLRELFESIVATDGDSHVSGHRSSDVPVGRGRIGHEFSIGIGTPDSITEADDHGDKQRTQRGVSEPDPPDYATSVRAIDDEISVVADLAGVDPATLSAGINSHTAELVIATNGDVIERVTLPHGRLTIADTWYNNGILELSLQEDNG
jgi:HSP20 family molecular chaperone IbpA